MLTSDMTASLQQVHPPANYSVCLKALWYDAKGDWSAAHELINDLSDSNAAWVHAYLHRKEGDSGNAAYWYRRAGKDYPACSLEAEWTRLVTAL
ncbi:MAG: hypothetical protein KGO92_13700 [Bacteroidota bacterium]|nr:hypothetical protein [Bacteroidota bacterium]